MPPATLTSVAREHMADAILSMQDACHDDGLAYPEEMTALVLAWLYTRRAQGRGGEILIDAPEPDAGEQSPGHILLRHAASTPPGRLTVESLPPPTPPEPTQPEPVAEPPLRHATHTDDGRQGVMIAPCPRHRTTDDTEILPTSTLYGILRDGGSLDGVRGLDPGRLRIRCSMLSQRCSSHRLRVKGLPDGTLKIFRRPR